MNNTDELIEDVVDRNINTIKDICTQFSQSAEVAEIKMATENFEKEIKKIYEKYKQFKYELTFLVNSTATEREKEELIKDIAAFLSAYGDYVSKTEDIGIRKLAYKIKKYKEADYITLSVYMKKETSLKLNDFCKIKSEILKFIIIKYDFCTN